MGNRGILHDENQRLGRARWRHKAWIICVLSWKNWHRDVMQPGNYTELFFLDEAVALAAGHRPCAMCRRAAYDSYRAAAGLDMPAAQMDDQLHRERALPRIFAQKRHTAELSDLPNGAIYIDGTPKLVWNDAVYSVGSGGYGAAERRARGLATVLTPPTSCAALSAGYRPVLHPDFKPQR